MKFAKSILMFLFVCILLALAAPPAKAQSMDVFGKLRTVVVIPPTNIFNLNAGPITNNPVDIQQFIGVVKVDIAAGTNQPGGTLTANLQTSPDLTNWTALANFAASSSVSVIYTNNTYPQSLKATNIFLLPGTLVTPVASTAGFATPYLAPNLFTNSGAITLAAPNATTTVAFDSDAANRYLRIYFTPGGTSTNATVAATLTGHLVSQAGAP